MVLSAWRLVVAGLLVVSQGFSGCVQDPVDRAGDLAERSEYTPAPIEPSGPFEVDLVRLHAPTNRVRRMHVWVAADQEARSRGLMFRDHLPEGTGMVFLFPRDNSGGFWMKNTRIPLSIAFFDAEGRVLAVLDMEPCEADPCPTYDPGVSYRGALEVEQGYFDDIGLDERWRIEAPEGHEVS